MKAEPCGDLDGPSRTIIVEPRREPATAPVRVPEEPARSPSPAPEPSPSPSPEREREPDEVPA